MFSENVVSSAGSSLEQAPSGTERLISTDPDTKITKVAINIKKLSEPSERGDLRYTGGGRLCGGCGQGILLRNLLLSVRNPIVVTNNTGCVFVSSTPYPNSAWSIPYLHTTLAGAPAAMSGVLAAFKYRLKEKTVREDIKFLIYGGDGGFYDIGLSALSGAFHRRDDVFAVCGNNQAYMNTGIQESGASFKNSRTTTTPSGTIIFGNKDVQKNLPKIMEAHRSPYVAQTGVHNFLDLIRKSRKGFLIEGPTYLEVYAPCPLGWYHPTDQTINSSRLACETCLFPSYEVEQGEFALTAESLMIYNKKKEKIPIREYYKTEGRFRHLFGNPEGEAKLDLIQQFIDEEWETLMARHVARK